MRKLAKFCSDRKWVWVILVAWIIAAGALSAAPSANEYKVNTGEDDLPSDALSVIASDKVNTYFSDDDGLLGLLVFYNEAGWNEANYKEIDKVSEWLTDNPEITTVQSMIPYHLFPEQAKGVFQSENETTIVLPMMLNDGLEMSEINDTITAIQQYSDDVMEVGVLKITGPAGIASDTIAIFSNADLVLLFSTIGLVLILLIVIYRSPLLAIIPLVAVVFVYQVVDRVLGLFAANGAFTIENQSLSIVMILLFGATTDYCLFVFSRYREELRKVESKHTAMQEAVTEVAEPIFFSGGTVFAAMLVLLLANYGPYQNFSYVFAITIAIVLLAGLTLIPALFTIVGRRSFWPVIPKVGEKTLEKNRFWGSVGSFVTKRPILSASVVLVILLVNAFNVTTIKYSFNLINSFPEEMNSRIGFEILESSYPAGELAPVTVLIEREEGLLLEEEEYQSFEKLNEKLLSVEGVASTSLPEHDAIADNAQMHGSELYSDDERALKFNLLMEVNPYTLEALDTMDLLNESRETFLQESGLEGYQLYFAGETAKQADVRKLNDRDTAVVIIAVTLIIFIMLIMHSRSLVAPIYMMSTILISYLSALGFGWFIFQYVLGFEGMSYRIPLYAFVFLVALGVDYNIMLISRIKEEYRTFEIKEAVRRGVALTGGVISSAGLILAATFGVLMTQPIMELFMFGFIVSIGILMDAFIVRGVLVPAIVTMLGRWNWWPAKSEKMKAKQ